MKCGGCVRAVETTLLDQPGVQRADVNLVSRSAWLDLTAGEIDVDDVLKALADRGFPAKERSLDAPIGGMAAGQVRKFVEAVAGGAEDRRPCQIVPSMFAMSGK